MGAKHAKWFIRSTETTGWLRETELVPKTQGVVSSIKQMKFAINLARHSKAGLEFPPHVAKNVSEARSLRKIVRDQDRQGALGHVQGERALAKLMHGHGGEKTLDEIYEAPGAFKRPYLPGENDGQPTGVGAGSAGAGANTVGGANEGMGSRTQADVTPGAEPTKKPGGGA